MGSFAAEISMNLACVGVFVVQGNYGDQSLSSGTSRSYET